MELILINCVIARRGHPVRQCYTSSVVDAIVCFHQTTIGIIESIEILRKKQCHILPRQTQRLNAFMNKSIDTSSSAGRATACTSNFNTDI